jgi:ribosomal RNA assembly protein
VEIQDPKDTLKGMRAREVVHAIARGFSPEKALKLFDNESLMFETIDLSNIARTEKDLERIRGRIIGSGGKTREFFENLTSTNISVYGKTVSLIGFPEQNTLARKGLTCSSRGLLTVRFISSLRERRVNLNSLNWVYN